MTSPACMPIGLPDGRKQETLSGCRAYILALPAKEQKSWEPVVAALLTAAERDDSPWSFFARLSFSRKLHGVEGVARARRSRHSQNTAAFGRLWPVQRLQVRSCRHTVP